MVTCVWLHNLEVNYYEQWHFNWNRQRERAKKNCHFTMCSNNGQHCMCHADERVFTQCKSTCFRPFMHLPSIQVEAAINKFICFIQAMSCVNRMYEWLYGIDECCLLKIAFVFPMHQLPGGYFISMCDCKTTPKIAARINFSVRTDKSKFNNCLVE